ncbi:MAG TPA: hypothetical protein GX707_04055 [Epulopiscium sp.]|nr:hypothetical protein [Candidatus Epulonipiscium sp.]
MGCYEQCMGNQLIILSTLLSLVISDNLSSDQLNTLGNFIVAVGSLMLTKAAEIQALDLNKIILWLRCSNK